MKPKILVHGRMAYKCPECGAIKTIQLEIGVEDFGRHGRRHQPSPFMIPCSCGDFMMDVSGCKPYPAPFELDANTPYFAYDDSGKDGACGKLHTYESVTRETIRMIFERSSKQEGSHETKTDIT